MANRGIAARITGKHMIILTTAANATPADGAAFTCKNGEAIAFELMMNGTASQGTIAVTIQDSSTTDANASFATVALANLEVRRGAFWDANPKTFAFGQSLTSPHYIGYAGNGKFVRAITSGAAGTPDFGIYIGVVATRRRHIGGV